MDATLCAELIKSESFDGVAAKGSTPEAQIKVEDSSVIIIEDSPGQTEHLLRDSPLHAIDDLLLTSALEKVEDEVPADFFDDFNNKDFLAGLDVVDAWEDEDGNSSKTSEPAVKAASNDQPVCSDAGKDVDEVVDKATIPAVSSVKSSVSSSANSEEKDGYVKVVKYTIPKRKEVKENEKEEKAKGAASRKYTDENRRDPDKVKRDIQRDKARCERQRITEKLRLVETGLVPPGTEMDVPDALPEATAACGRRETSRIVKRVACASRSPSPAYRPPRKRRCSRSPVANISRRRYSPSPSSHRRRISRSPLPRRPRNRTRSRSRSSSPATSRDRRYRSAATSGAASKYRASPEPRKPSFLDEIDRKLSRIQRVHMQKITAAINGETHALLPTPVNAPPPVQPVLPMPMAMPMMAPQMVPAPTILYDAGGTAASYQDVVYDQSFFVGANNAYNMGAYAQAAPAPTLPYDAFQQHQHQQPATVSYAHAMHSYENMQEANRKLFKDDSISLTEYLKLTQRSDNAQQINLSQKLKVLNRCQDALKLISELQRPNGRFYYQVTSGSIVDEGSSEEATAEGAGAVAAARSPMSAGGVRLAFTSKRTSQARQPTALDRLLARLELTTVARRVPLPVTITTATASAATTSTAAIGMEHQLLAAAAPRVTSVACQTAAASCMACAARARVRYTDAASQCAPPSTLEFGAQVTEDDFLTTARSALKHLIKQQSFASLTPAQILAQLSRSEEAEGGGGGGGNASTSSTPRPRAAASSDYDYERRENRSSGDFLVERWGGQRPPPSSAAYGTSPPKQYAPRVPSMPMPGAGYSGAMRPPRPLGYRPPYYPPPTDNFGNHNFNIRRY